MQPDSPTSPSPPISDPPENPEPIIRAVFDAWREADPFRLGILVQSAPGYVAMSLYHRIVPILGADPSIRDETLRQACRFLRDDDPRAHQIGFPPEGVESAEQIIADLADCIQRNAPYPN